MSDVRNIIEKNGYYCATIHGYSMYPLLKNHNDSVYIEKCDNYKKHDVVLYERKSGKLILHRILKVKNDHYIICGDNEYYKEKVFKNQVLGKMTEFSRNSKEYTVKNPWYKIYSRVWCFSFFTKRIFILLYNKYQCLKKKLKR